MTVMITGESRNMTVIGAPDMIIKMIRGGVKMTGRNTAVMITE